MKDPKEAKQYGKQAKLRSDWHTVKFQVMEDVVRQKFQNPELKHKLLATGSCYIMEGNIWNDTVWGIAVVDGQLVGENNLGTILMKIRSES